MSLAKLEDYERSKEMQYGKNPNHRKKLSKIENAMIDKHLLMKIKGGLISKILIA